MGEIHTTRELSMQMIKGNVSFLGHAHSDHGYYLVETCILGIIRETKDAVCIQHQDRDRGG